MSESDIDMDRAMQGIDCEAMQITWTNCAERMPPDDNTEIIVLSSADGEYHKLTGAFLNGPLQKKYGVRLAEELWTLYTPEKWKELKNE